LLIYEESILYSHRLLEIVYSQKYWSYINNDILLLKVCDFNFTIAFFVYFVVLGAGVPDVGVGMQDLEIPSEESQQLRHHFEGR
jgi:hypothetical protein